MKMPPKKCLPKNLSTNTASTSNEIPISPDIAQQFETELCWCIQQLQTGLRLGKLNPKQVQDHTKALNTLMSSSAPMVKKRQVMRLSFGNYRTKMLEEDKKSSVVNTKIKVARVLPSVKSMFVKKSNYVPVSNDSYKLNTKNSSGNTATRIEIKLHDAKTNMGNFHFVPTNNSFRFNFSNEDKI